MPAAERRTMKNCSIVVQLGTSAGAVDTIGGVERSASVDLEVIRWNGAATPDAADLGGRLGREGFDVVVWTDAPSTHYAAHAHASDEVIWVVDGAIEFHAGGSAFRLGPGDRLILPAGTRHTADAGARGATYLIGERRR